MKSKKYIFVFTLLLGMGVVHAQQNHTLFLAHSVPESNLLNPAVPISCKWYIGIPVLSSTHLNYGNSSFSYKNLFESTGNGSYITTIDNVIDRLHWRNYIGTEIHTQLFALGYRYEDYSFMFTLTEKNNLPILFPKQTMLLLWNGNSQFEGQSASFKGTDIYFNHYREYALSFSKKQKDGIYLGVRAKLLFGKLNLSPASTDISLTTDDTSFNLHLNGDLKINSSLPIVVESSDSGIEDVYYDESISPLALALNRKNLGFGLDFGIIYPYNNRIELSASIIDLGFIKWKSNLNTISGEGEFNFDGPLGEETDTENYLRELSSEFLDSLQVEASQEKYTTFLQTRILGGATYTVNSKFKTGLQAEAIVYSSKVIPSATLSANYEPTRNINLLASYTIQYYSLKSLGLGFVVGRNPVQFYMMSDDVIGAIWPMSARNINLRFGLNIIFGCNIREKNDYGKGMLQGNCYWLEKSIQDNFKRDERLKKKK